jgi:catechol 2,3-dioxygenase-like lactoylglutathione lyase family enzyme
MKRTSVSRWLCAFAASIVAFSAQSLFAQLAPPNESGVTLGHVHLVVRDVEAQKKIWTEVLGAQITHAGSLEMLKIPGTYILLTATKSEPPEGTPVLDHIGLLVQDLAAVKAKLAAANVQIPDKIPIATLPDGVRVEFLEDKKLEVPLAFHHYHIFMAGDAEAVRSWYVKTFGALASTRRGTMPTANFPAGPNFPGGEVDFMAQPNTQRVPTKGHPLDHIGFEVKGLEAFCKKLEAEGIKFEIPYRDVPQIGLKIAFIADPIGTRIELTEGLAGK